jgi:predicted AlkP superfamily pyrophosphatase or phosphodiesterase
MKLLFRKLSGMMRAQPVVFAFSCAWAFIAMCALSVPAQSAEGTATEWRGTWHPKLVLQLTVDQLRGDLLPRYQSRFGSGGFGLLFNRGAYFANAHYETANTITCAGHTVLVTGADVAQHGIVGNEWFDREAGRTVYCVEDARYPAVGEPSKKGMSPARLTSSTTGDEIVIASGHRARAFAVAGKDRSSIVPGGHLGKAFWMSDITGGVATSQYYYDALPPWVSAWNDRKAFTRYRDAGWTLMYPQSSYINANLADNKFAHVKAGMTRTFPHTLNMPDPELVKALRFTPFLDEMTADFARELITQEKLGQNGVTDYLSISFSATDYVGHSFGPNSVESEDNLLHLDKTLANLFAFIDRTIGLKNTVIVLSADHGADDIPEEHKAAGYDADRGGGEPLRSRLSAALKERFNTEGLLTASLPPNFYLDRAKIAASHLDPLVVENALADLLRNEPGIALVFTRTDLMAGRIAHTVIFDRIQRAFHPTRSGDVIAVEKQFWYFDEEPEYYAATHGSPYSYDTYVPIFVFAPRIDPGTIRTPAAPAQIAPTLAAMLGIRPPSGCVCDPPLPHLFERR